MRFNSSVTICLVALTLLASSCSEYNKICKSGSSREKYDKALEYYADGKYNKSLTLLKDVEHVYSHAEQGDTVLFYMGMSYYQMKDYASSCEQFDGFRREYLRSPFLEQAEYYLARGFYNLSPDPDNDQSFTYRAMQAINEYLDRYPNSAQREALVGDMVELRQKLYDKAYLNARLYYDVGYYNSAVTALRNAILTYPESDHHEELAYLIVRSQCLFARNSVAKLQRQRYLDTQNAYYSFIAEYPESKFRKDADKMQDEAKAYLERYKEDPNYVAPETLDEKEAKNDAALTSTSSSTFGVDQTKDENETVTKKSKQEKAAAREASKKQKATIKQAEKSDKQTLKTERKLRKENSEATR
ncbi:MAG: outer membrane protein assembly factor BamD [Alistipes sp.]|nr:outer membrane protein assembly factor BamD [Alistipes sp.]